jgi:hypothetical protein
MYHGGDEEIKLSQEAKISFRPGMHFCLDMLAPLLKPEAYEAREAGLRLSTEAIKSHQSVHRDVAGKRIENMLPRTWLHQHSSQLHPWVASYQAVGRKEFNEDRGAMVSILDHIDVRFALEPQERLALLRAYYPKVADMDPDSARRTLAEAYGEGKGLLYVSIEPDELPFERRKTKDELDNHMMRMNLLLGDRAMRSKYTVEALPKIIIPYK